MWSSTQGQSSPNTARLSRPAVTMASSDSSRLQQQWRYRVASYFLSLAIALCYEYEVQTISSSARASCTMQCMHHHHHAARILIQVHRTKFEATCTHDIVSDTRARCALMMIRTMVRRLEDLRTSTTRVSRRCPLSLLRSPSVAVSISACTSDTRSGKGVQRTYGVSKK